LLAASHLVTPVVARGAEPLMNDDPSDNAEPRKLSLRDSWSRLVLVVAHVLSSLVARSREPAIQPIKMLTEMKAILRKRNKKEAELTRGMSRVFSGRVRETSICPICRNKVGTSEAELVAGVWYHAYCALEAGLVVNNIDDFIMPYIVVKPVPNPPNDVEDLKTGLTPAEIDMQIMEMGRQLELLGHNMTGWDIDRQRGVYRADCVRCLRFAELTASTARSGGSALEGRCPTLAESREPRTEADERCPKCGAALVFDHWVDRHVFTCWGKHFI
jgi:hypothetical protein